MQYRKAFQMLGIAGLILAGLTMAGCQQKQPPRPVGPAEVATVTVQTETVTLSTELPGRISAFLVAEIRPQVNGLLQSRHFQEGAFVKAGDLLYQIDPAPYQTAFNQAQAALVTAEADLVVAEANLPALRARAGRLKDLAAARAVGQQDSDDADAALRQALASLEAKKAAVGINRAAVENARINLSYTPIKAPISGRIGKSNLTVGALVTAYQPTALAMIQQLDPVYVDVTQANADILRLRKNLESGQLASSGAARNKVKLILEDGSAYPQEGVLQFQDATVGLSTGSVTLRIVFPNPRQVLLPGMYVRAVVEEGVKEQAILVPQQGVMRDTRGNPVAWVVDREGKVVKKDLVLDRAIGDKWLVSSGLSTGDQVIVEGSQKTKPGEKVKAVPFQGNAAGAPAGSAH